MGDKKISKTYCVFVEIFCVWNRKVFDLSSSLSYLSRYKAGQIEKYSRKDVFFTIFFKPGAVKKKSKKVKTLSGENKKFCELFSFSLSRFNRVFRARCNIFLNFPLYTPGKTETNIFCCVVQCVESTHRPLSVNLVQYLLSHVGGKNYSLLLHTA